MYPIDNNFLFDRKSIRQEKDWSKEKSRTEGKGTVGGFFSIQKGGWREKQAWSVVWVSYLA